MDKNGFESEQQQSCCEKLFIAIRKPSPFIRPTRFISPVTLRDRCVRVPRVDNVTTETPPNVIMTTTNLNDRCPRISKQTVTPPAADSRKQAANKVAVIQDHKRNHPRVSSPINNLPRPPKTTMVPIDGCEDTIPVIPHANGAKSYIAESINGMSSEYIDRVGKKIRSPTNVGARDSFNDRVNDYINRTKNKFHTSPSFNEGSEGKQKRLK
uniref:Uncharacterized protein n=1 Tax=Chenopodium quinoa TaxID=63459 RepID=A0A803LD12_CHEQI